MRLVFAGLVARVLARVGRADSGGCSHAGNGCLRGFWRVVGELGGGVVGSGR